MLFLIRVALPDLKLMNNNSLYFNFYSGVSGDMLIGSLIDIGVKKDDLIKILRKIDKNVSLNVKKVFRGLNNCTLIEPVIPNNLNKFTYCSIFSL